MKYVKNAAYFALALVALYCLQQVRDALGKKWMKLFSDTLAFMSAKLDEIQSNSILMDSIGEHRNYSLEYNEPGVPKDTLPYTITIWGDRGELMYKAIEVRTGEQWAMLRDTLSIELELSPDPSLEKNNTSVRVIIMALFTIAEAGTILGGIVLVIIHLSKENSNKAIKYSFSFIGVLIALIFLQIIVDLYLFPRPTAQ